MPKCAPTCFDDLNRAGSSMAEATVSATIAPTQRATQAHLDIAKLRLHQLARGEHRSHLLCRYRLAMHRPEPAKPHQLGNAAAIIAIGLHRHGLEGIAHMARLQQLDRKLGLLHSREKPLR